MGEDEHETLLTRVDPDGTPVETWVMEYEFDFAFRFLDEDGTMDTSWRFSLKDLKLRGVVSFNRYCTVEEVSSWIRDTGADVCSVFMWIPGETGCLELCIHGADIQSEIDEHLQTEEKWLAEAPPEAQDETRASFLKKLRDGKYRVFAVSVEAPPLEVLKFKHQLRPTGWIRYSYLESLGRTGTPPKPDGAD